jgi:hypothetical protein
MKIEKCTDASLLIDVINDWKKECNDNEFNMVGNEEITLDHLSKIISNENCVIFMMSNNEKPVGFIGVVTFIFPITGTKIANEHLWYVIKEHRGISSVKLLKTAMAWARKKRCLHFLGNASMLASNLHDSVCELYKTLGMKHFESTFIYSFEGEKI